MVPEGVLAVEVLVAGLASSLETGLLGLFGGGSPSLENLLGKDFGRDRGKRSNAALEVIPTGDQRLVNEPSSRNREQDWGESILPVTSHVAPLQIAVAEGDLTSVAGVWMR